MDELRCLLLDGLHDVGMAMAGGHDGDAGVHVQEAVAVHVFDDGSPAALDDKRIAAGIARRDIAMVFFDHFLGLGAGQLGFDVGKFKLSSCVCSHVYGTSDFISVSDGDRQSLGTAGIDRESVRTDRTPHVRPEIKGD